MVLLVNDHPPTLLALESVLEQPAGAQRYEVRSVTSGEEALRLALSHRFAVILLDVSMPGMDGFAVAEMIHARPSSANTPIIFLTAHYENEVYRIRGYQLGAVDFLVTPVLPEVLRAKVAVFVELEKRAVALERMARDLREVNESLQAQRVRELQSHNTLLQAEVEERKQAEQKAYELATRDPLTGLLNRRLLMEELEHAVQEAKRYQERIALLFLDLDKFKPINDTHGHEVGDQVLIEAARRIKNSLREADLVARFGGDEFVVLIKGEEAEPARSVTKVVDKISAAIATPFHIGEHVITTSTSIGVAIYSVDGNSSVELLRNADAAMYQAKRRRTTGRTLPVPGCR